MRKSNKLIFYGVIALALLILLGSLVHFFKTPKQDTTDLDKFVDYLIEKNVKMYGYFGCGYCKNQKEDFGDSWNKFAEKGGYVECSDYGDYANLSACNENNITAYPAWIINGETVLGYYSIDELKGLTGFS